MKIDWKSVWKEFDSWVKANRQLNGTPGMARIHRYTESIVNRQLCENSLLPNWGKVFEKVNAKVAHNNVVDLEIIKMCIESEVRRCFES